MSTAIGDFSDVLRVLETTELEPDVVGFKYYAPGFGLILEEEDLDENLHDPGLRIEYIGTASVPEPGTGLMLGIGVFEIAEASRRKLRMTAGRQRQT